MNKLYSFLLIALVAIPTSAFSAETAFNGSADFGVRGVSLDNQSGRFNEYQNIDDGVIGSANINAQNEGRYLNLQMQYAGGNDESFKVRGGQYGSYKYSLFYNEMPHNYSYDNRTIYSGIGTNSLSYFAVDAAAPAAYTPNVPTDTSLWNRFEYGIDKKKYGVSLDVDLTAPFYAKLDLRREETDGVKPLGVASGVYGSFSALNFSPFGQVVELPEPVNYENTTLQLAGGYSTEKLLVELAGSISSFENSNDLLTWRNPYVTTQELSETNVLAPDSDYYKLSAKTVVKQLPMDSVLALKASIAKMESDIPLLDGIWSSTPAPSYSFINLGLNQSKFEGDVTTTKISLALSSKPTAKLSSKVYYDYFDKDNDSSHIVYTSLATGEEVENHLFEYEKHRAGFDLAYKLTPTNKLSGGYEFKTVDREREDFESNTDNKVFVQLKNTAIDNMAVKLKLQYLDRSADFTQEDDGGAASILLYQKRYDVADKKQTMAKLGVEFYPTDNFDLGLEYRYKLNDYDETRIGLTEEVRHEIYADAVYRIPDVVRLSGYAGYEISSQDSDHRQYSTMPDPTSGNTATDFNWSQELKNDYVSLGVMAEVPLIKNKLDAVLAYNYQQNDGSNDMSSEGLTTLEDIDAVNDYDLHQVEAKCLYTISKNMKMTLGYLYEKMDYSDDQYDDYNNFKVGGFDSYYLSGAYADNDYEVNIGYLALSYLF